MSVNSGIWCFANRIHDTSNPQVLIININYVNNVSRYWMNVLHSSQSSYHGCLGAMGPTPCYGTHLARSLLNLECSKVTPPRSFAVCISASQAGSKCGS